MRNLHLVEPGLVSTAGHCYELSRSLVSAWLRRSDRARVFLWVGDSFPEELQQSIRLNHRVEICRYFHRHYRKIQALFLYRRHWLDDAVITLPTARLFDLVLLWMARPAYPLAQPVAYLHWFNAKLWRLRLLKWLTARVPELRLLTTTEYLCNILQNFGIDRVSYQPYPLTATIGEKTCSDAAVFSHLLYAGAAREDKGFPSVVALLETLARSGRLPRAVIQVNGEKSVEPASAISGSISRLRKLALAHSQIEIIEETLSSADYRSLFQGAVVLQLYDPFSFQNRVSGVTLDALAAGAVPVVIRGTWSARLLEHEAAGAVLEDQQSAEALLTLLDRLISNFSEESARSRAAHVRLSQQENWNVFFEGLRREQPWTNRLGATLPGRILVIQMRRIGDVLLCSPITNSLKKAFPNSRITALVFSETAAVLNGVDHVDEVIDIPSRSSWSSQLRLLAKIFRSYDISLCPSTSDRPLILARLAARRSFAFRRTGWSWIFTGTVPFDDYETHTVLQNLRLIHLLGVKGEATVKAPLAALPLKYVPDKPYLVIHPFPKFEYKKWRIEHWQFLIDSIAACHFQVVISGGLEPEERLYNSQLIGAIDLTGCLSLAELSSLLAGAIAYVGPDTATTHIAAALGIPTVAIFGPSNPVKWGPWPRTHDSPGGFDQSPWQIRGSQRCGNVFLVQGSGDCVPCLHEGCDRHIGSRSQCLDALEPDSVLEALRSLRVLV